MTALLPPLPATEPEDAYESFWHATEDDVGVPDFDADEHPEDGDDVYFTYVSRVEA